MSHEDARAKVPDWKWTAAVTKDGAAHDITRELAVMYDAIVGSMDWGSGFLDIEDVEALLRIGALCGFESGEYDLPRQGQPVFIDADEGAMNKTQRNAGYLNGWAQVALTAKGRKVTVKNVDVLRPGTAVAVALVGYNGERRARYQLPEPLEIPGDASVEVSFYVK